MEIGDKLKLLRERMGISPEKLGNRIGMSGIYIRRIERGDRRNITLETARKLAEGLGVIPGVFIDQAPIPAEPSPEKLLSDLEVLIKAYIPVYSQISADPELNPIDYIVITREKAAPETYRAYRVKGLCFEPEIRDGDTLVIDTALSPMDGDLVIVLIEDTAFISKYSDKEPDKNGFLIHDGKTGYQHMEYDHKKESPKNVHLHGVIIEYSRRIR